MLERYLNSKPTMTERLAGLGQSNTNTNVGASSEEKVKERENELKEFVWMWYQSWEASGMTKEG